jgi:hypothetical protein
MTPEKLAEVRAKALAGRQRARREREAARESLEPAGAPVSGQDLSGLPQPEAVALNAAAWNLTEDQAQRRLEREAGTTSVQVVVPATALDAAHAPTVAIGTQRR